MSTRIYSTRFFEGIVAGTGTNVHCFTVPAGHVYLIQWLNVFVQEASATARLVHPGGSIWAFFTSPAVNSTLSRECRLVANPGETIDFFTDVGTWHVSLHGTDLVV